MLRSHYRSPIEVTPETIAEAEAGLAQLDEFARRFGLGDLLVDGPVVDRPVPDATGRRRRRRGGPLPGRMDDDLDTPGALAIVFDLVRRANTRRRRRRPRRR